MRPGTHPSTCRIQTNENHIEESVKQGLGWNECLGMNLISGVESEEKVIFPVT
jgi:hypothetical protein